MVVKVKKEIVDLINKALNNKKWNYTKSEIYEVHYRMVIDKNGKWVDDMSPLNDVSTKELLAVLFGEYEIEETPEEKILKIYKNYLELKDHFDDDVAKQAHGFLLGVNFTLQNLNVKIEGINK